MIAVRGRNARRPEGPFSSQPGLSGALALTGARGLDRRRAGFGAAPGLPRLGVPLKVLP